MKTEVAFLKGCNAAPTNGRTDGRKYSQLENKKRDPKKTEKTKQKQNKQTKKRMLEMKEFLKRIVIEG